MRNRPRHLLPSRTRPNIRPAPISATIRYGRFRHRREVGSKLPTTEIKGRHCSQDYRCADRNILCRTWTPNCTLRCRLRLDGKTHRAEDVLTLRLFALADPAIHKKRTAHCRPFHSLLSPHPTPHPAPTSHSGPRASPSAAMHQSPSRDRRPCTYRKSSSAPRSPPPSPPFRRQSGR